MKHKWVNRFEIDKEATGNSWTVCKRCGVILRADSANKDKPCRGLVKITMRKKSAAKKPKA